MPVIRIYDKGGTLLSAGSTSPIAPVKNGRLAWLGGEMYISSNGTRVDQFAIGNVAMAPGVTATFVKNIVAGDASTLFRGVEVSRRQMLDGEGETWFEPDGQHLFVISRSTISAAIHLELRVYDLSNNALVWTHDFGLSNVEGGITTNGHMWMVGHVLSTGLTQFTLFEADGTTVNILGAARPALPATDMCHDGMYTWALEEGIIKQYEVRPTGPILNLVSQFTPAGAEHLGLTTNGHNLITLSFS